MTLACIWFSQLMTHNFKFYYNFVCLHVYKIIILAKFIKMKDMT